MKKPLQLTHFCPPTFEACEDVVVDRNILELQILSLTFKHHPLFSLEHVLQQKLVDLYDDHRQSKVENKLQRLSNRLEALRNARDNLKRQTGDGADENVRATEKEITELRELLFEEGKAERDVIKGLLKTWKAIKNLREHKKYSNTPIRLLIKKEVVDSLEEKSVLELQIQQTLTEILEERDSSKSRKQLKKELIAKFQESFKPPGEPKLHFEVAYDNEVTADVDDSKEKLRRACVKNTKIYLKIICNDVDVCRTKHVNLNERFTCVFEENFSIQLNSVLPNISVEILEQTGALLKRKCGEIVLPLLSESQICEQHFLKEELIQYNKHEGTGSGVSLSTLLSQLGNLVYTF